MNGTVELKTERLVLRRHRTEDADILFRKFGSDAEMYKYSGWNPYETAEMAENTVNAFVNSYADPCFYGWAVEKDGKLIGTVGAYDLEKEKSRIEIGMSIERDSWGHGYASEALSAVLSYLTEKEEIKEVTAWCASDNIGSVRAMEKAGMKQTGIEPEALEIDGKKYDKLIFGYRRRETI